MAEVQGSAGLVVSGFPCIKRSRKKKTTGDKGKTVHSFHSFIYSLPTKQDRVLPVVHEECPSMAFVIFLGMAGAEFVAQAHFERRSTDP